MFKTFGDIFKIPQLRNKVLFTLAIIIAYRIGASVPIPGINAAAVKSLFDANSNGLLGFLESPAKKTKALNTRITIGTRNARVNSGCSKHENKLPGMAMRSRQYARILLIS